MITRELAGETITIVPNGVLEYRVRWNIVEDGEVIAERNHRTTFVPTSVIADLPSVRLRRVATAVWTQAVIDAYIAAQGTAV